MGLSPETRFGFRYTVWLRACGLATGVFVESIVNAGMRDSFGIVIAFGKAGRKVEALWGQPERTAGSPEVGKCLFSFS